MITVGEIMTTELLTLHDTDSVGSARSLMAERHIRHIPVVNEDEEFVGLLTQRDILAVGISALAEADPSEVEALETTIPLREVMTTDLAVVEEDSELREAAQYLLSHKLGCLPVISGGNLVGIITEADFLKLVINLLDRLET